MTQIPKLWIEVSKLLEVFVCAEVGGLQEQLERSYNTPESNKIRA